MPDTIRYELVNFTMVLVHNTRPPSDQEWRDYLEVLKQKKASVKKILVFAVGNGPNAVQRSMYNKTIQENDIRPKVAIISGSAIVRGIVTAFNWFKMDSMQMFPPTGLKDASDYLELTSMEYTTVVGVIDRFRAELGG